MSWYHLKSLDTRDWQSILDKKDNNDNLNIIFKNVLKRCGRFLAHLQVDIPYQSKWDSEIVDMILKECTNLKDVDIGYQTFISQDDIEVIKPIFDKVTKLYCSIDESDIKDEDLEGLFTINKKLEHFEMITNEKVTSNVLNVLPCDTIRNLALHTFKSSSLFLLNLNVSIKIL